MASRQSKGQAGARGQDSAISDVTRGLNPGTSAGISEDEKRERGIDASADAGEHDPSPEANRSVGPGGLVLDTYAGARHQHDNLVGEQQELVVGQAPQGRNAPMRGSPAYGEGFHPDVPNAINRSPVVRGVEKDPRNDPSHPGFRQADRSHPDYGKPAAQHEGVRTEAPSYASLKGQDPEPAELEGEEQGESAAA